MYSWSAVCLLFTGRLPFLLPRRIPVAVVSNARSVRSPLLLVSPSPHIFVSQGLPGNSFPIFSTRRRRCLRLGLTSFFLAVVSQLRLAASRVRRFRALRFYPRRSCFKTLCWATPRCRTVHRLRQQTSGCPSPSTRMPSTWRSCIFSSTKATGARTAAAGVSRRLTSRGTSSSVRVAAPEKAR